MTDKCLICKVKSGSQGFKKLDPDPEKGPDPERGSGSATRYVICQLQEKVAKTGLKRGAIPKGLNRAKKMPRSASTLLEIALYR